MIAGVKILPVFSQLPREQIPAPGAKVVEKSSTFLRTPYRKRLLEVSLRRKYGEIIAKLQTAACCVPGIGSRSHQSAKFLPRIAAAALPQPFPTKEKLPHLPTRESLRLLIERDYLFFRTLHHAECEVCTRRFIVRASPHAKC